MKDTHTKRLASLLAALCATVQLTACSAGTPTPAGTTEPPQTTPVPATSTSTIGTLPPVALQTTPPESSASSNSTSATTPPVMSTTTGVQTSGKDGKTASTTPIDLGNVLVIGNSAMEHYYGVDSVLESYAGTVSSIKAQLPDVNVYAMFCPSAVEFCAPAKYQAGTRSQQRAMNVIYDALQNGALGVDTWSELNQHATEYLYFRTDHHWTQRGAYYAYVAFCKTAGIEPHDLSEYETGLVENFVGTMSIYAKDYAERFYQNPDTVEYFRPIHSSTMTVYASANLTNGSARSVVASQESADKMARGSKYSMFLAGDNPITHIVSDTIRNGRVCIVTKESYGNALVPFLTDHFEEIYVIDPRQFNTSGKPSLNLINFAREHGATDIVCINASVLLPGINQYLKKMI